MPNLADEVVLDHQQWYMNRPDLLRRMVERSRRYLHHIVEEIEKRGMPTELALLPMVEFLQSDGLLPCPRLGTLAVHPATGKRYNLAQDWWQDQRRDIVASTAAALDYLQAIYEMNGDWHLALASYNWGENAVKRAVERIRPGASTDFSSLTMPAETRNYVPKLQALKNIFNNPRLMAQLRPPRPCSINLISQRLPRESPWTSRRPPCLAKCRSPNSWPSTPPITARSSHRTVRGHHSRRQSGQPSRPIWKPRRALRPLAVYTLKPGERLERLAPRFGISLGELKHVSQRPRRAHASRRRLLVLVPAGRDGVDLDDLAPQARLPRIEADPPCSGRSQRGKTRGEVRAAVAKGFRQSNAAGCRSWGDEEDCRPDLPGRGGVARSGPVKPPAVKSAAGKPPQLPVKVAVRATAAGLTFPPRSAFRFTPAGRG